MNDKMTDEYAEWLLKCDFKWRKACLTCDDPRRIKEGHPLFIEGVVTCAKCLVPYAIADAITEMFSYNSYDEIVSLQMRYAKMLSEKFKGESNG
tara:strand:+ start:325 stop:606 length:282 start_codon:yes stop_codon:yes gene_type:complete